MGKFNAKRLLKELNASSSILTLAEMDILTDAIRTVLLKYHDSPITNAEKNTKVKLEVRSIIGKEGIKLKNADYNQIMSRKITEVSNQISKEFYAARATKSIPDTPVEEVKTPSHTIETASEDIITQPVDSGATSNVSQSPSNPPMETASVSRENDTQWKYTPNTDATYSKGEKAVADILKRMGIPFKHEGVLEGLVTTGDSNKHLPCDFIISVDGRIGMIEYNGEQHYEAINDVLKYNRQITNDLKRTQFALDNGLPYLTIHFEDYAQMGAIIRKFITDIENCIATPSKYTNKSFGYFSPYRKENNELHMDIFGSPEPRIKRNNDLGYLEINAETVLIWDKNKLEALLNDIYDKTKQNERLYAVNKQLSEQLLETTTALQEATKRLKSQTECSPSNENINVESHDNEDSNEEEYETFEVNNISVKAPRNLHAISIQRGREIPEPIKDFIMSIDKAATANDVRDILEHIGIKISLPSIRKYRQ